MEMLFYLSLSMLLLGTIFWVYLVYIHVSVTKDAEYFFDYKPLMKLYMYTVTPTMLAVILIAYPTYMMYTFHKLNQSTQTNQPVEEVDDSSHMITASDSQNKMPCGNIYVNSTSYTTNVIKVYEATSSTERISANVRVVRNRPARCRTDQTWQGRPVVEWRFVDHPGQANYQIRYVGRTGFPQFTFRRVR